MLESENLQSTDWRPWVNCCWNRKYVASQRIGMCGKRLEPCESTHDPHICLTHIFSYPKRLGTNKTWYPPLRTINFCNITRVYGIDSHDAGEPLILLHPVHPIQSYASPVYKRVNLASLTSSWVDYQLVLTYFFSFGRLTCAWWWSTAISQSVRLQLME